MDSPGSFMMNGGYKGRKEQGRNVPGGGMLVEGAESQSRAPQWAC